jgi:hypothetical protein
MSTQIKLIRNRCQCKLCGTIIESKHRHDFVSCKCGEIFTDGGLDYIRRGFYTDKNNLISLDEYEKLPIDKEE